jgi:hypothetical protein
MGLDNYPARDPDGTLLPEDEEAFRKAGIRLCSGLFSDGTVSFRGKVYDDLVEQVTRVTLYREWIPPETVWERRFGPVAAGGCLPAAIAGPGRAAAPAPPRSLGAALSSR